MELATFLAEYEKYLTSLRSFARLATVAPASIVDALLKRPFALPPLLHSVPGATEVGQELKQLSKQRKDVQADSATIDAWMHKVIHEVLDVREEGTRAMRGGAVSIPSIAHAAPPLRAAPSPGEAQAVARPTRWINAEIDDHEKNEPLAVDETYTIAIGVDTEQRTNALGNEVLEDADLFPDGVDQIELRVELHSDDFEIVAQVQVLKLKRTGKGINKTRFEITPRHEGRCVLIATIHKDRNFVQQLTISVSVGAAKAEPPATSSFSRPRNAIAGLLPRKVMIIIIPGIPKGYQFIVCDEQGSKMMNLKVEPDELSDAITTARNKLLAVVDLTDANNNPVFQAGIDIPAADADAALKIMARAGARLFQVLFKHAGGSTDVSNVGAWLRDLESENGDDKSIQIVSDSAPIPWPLLYVGDASENATLDWKNFLGMRHIIEQLPTVDQLGRGNAVIASDKPRLEVSINLNRKIDLEWRTDFVQSQEEFWTETARTSPRLRVTPRTQTQELIDALANSATADQILYFYGHAATAALGEKGGLDGSSLSLTDAKITLEQLNTDASTDIQLRGNPLVFINACESAELSPLFYAGFVPYFMMKGARGVIGTECRTPGVFAAKWAERFFKRFLNGEPLGLVFLELRREFLKEYNNPLGLLYAVHCSSDTQIQPAL